MREQGQRGTLLTTGAVPSTALEYTRYSSPEELVRDARLSRRVRTCLDTLGEH